MPSFPGRSSLSCMCDAENCAPCCVPRRHPTSIFPTAAALGRSQAHGPATGAAERGRCGGRTSVRWRILICHKGEETEQRLASVYDFLKVHWYRGAIIQNRASTVISALESPELHSEHCRWRVGRRCG